MAHITRVPLTAEQRAHDPLPNHPRQCAHCRRTFWRATPAAKMLPLFTIALLLHGTVIVLGYRARGGAAAQPEPIRQTVRVKVVDRPPEPPPKRPPVIERPAPAPPTPRPRQTTKPTRARTRPVAIGISKSATSDAGKGPAFAAGDTTLGTTAPIAPNLPASRLPGNGARYTAPRCRPPDIRYPERLKAQGIEGEALVTVNLDTKGKVVAVKILKSAVHPEFNAAAEQAARLRSCSPATADGVPIPYQMTYMHRFRVTEP